jgi:histidinol-phosphate aminotransferase
MPNNKAPNKIKNTPSAPEPRPWIKGLELYVGGKSTAKDGIEAVKLSSNESAVGASPLAIKAYREAAVKLHRYPDGNYTQLREALGKKHDIESRQIICGVGSDEILKLACRAYLAPSDEVIFPRHSFMMYPIAAASVGAVPVEVDDFNYTAQVDNILAAITEKTKLIFLANPNNPTGTYLTQDEVMRLWKNTPKNILLVLDSAYAEFINQPDYDAGIKIVNQAKNVLMTRTFSKLYGLAALRLGWGYACQDVIDALDKIRDPFNVPTSAQVAATAALADEKFEYHAKEHNRKWLEWLKNQFMDLGLTTVPSYTNFILIKFPKGEKSAEKANDFLLNRGFILRWLPNQGLGQFLRMTVGTEDENKKLISLLQEFMD